MPDISLSPILIWFLVGIFFYLTELALPGFIVFFFGVGAWCTSLCVWLFDMSLSMQLLIFISSSLVALLALRSYLRNAFLGATRDLDDSVIMGGAKSTGIVTEQIIPPAQGKVKYGGSFWKATADIQIEEGRVVEIVEQKDLTLKVKPAAAQGEE
ncbi:NfeD family protein [Desulfogranum japonicum]|uniref:NfeD family protein n=1 Tax=Desulfogranum japonicum TaxID=231447 RepID=UPI000424D50C|nr:NfeD family protein [Desulfogranum japonicum]